MQTSQAWITLALNTLSCSQKDLARRLSVSQTQISKWKNGDHMSSDMEDKFRKILKIGDARPEFVLWAGSTADARKWERLISYLAEFACEAAETGYDTDPLQDEIELLSVGISNALTKMGVAPPEAFPLELECFLNEDDNEDGDHSERLWKLLDDNSYTAAIQAIFESLNDVWGFYVAYVMNAVVDDDDSSLFDINTSIEACLLDLAASKIQIDEKFAPKFRMFQHQVSTKYLGWLTTLKDAAFRTGTPLRAELLDMISQDHGRLGHAAEAQAFGLNAGRLHPDIYMNELLLGMRVLHQVLPSILDKLGIKNFHIDESELSLKL